MERRLILAAALILAGSCGATAPAAPPQPAEPGQAYRGGLQEAPTVSAPPKFAYASKDSVFILNGPGKKSAGRYDFNGEWYSDDLEYDGERVIDAADAPNGKDVGYYYKDKNAQGGWLFSKLPFSQAGSSKELYRVYISWDGTNFYRYVVEGGTTRLANPE